MLPEMRESRAQCFCTAHPHPVVLVSHKSSHSSPPNITYLCPLYPMAHSLCIQMGIVRSKAMLSPVGNALFYASDPGSGDYSQKNHFPRRDTIHPDLLEPNQPANQPFSSSPADSWPAQAGRQATNQPASPPDTQTSQSLSPKLATDAAVFTS